MMRRSVGISNSKGMSHGLRVRGFQKQEAMPSLVILQMKSEHDVRTVRKTDSSSSFMFRHVIAAFALLPCVCGPATILLCECPAGPNINSPCSRI